MLCFPCSYYTSYLFYFILRRLIIIYFLGKGKKRSHNSNKKIRFRTDTNSSSTVDKNRNETTACYLQTLAHFGRWDEFSKILKEAQNSGFTKESLRFSTTRTDYMFDQNIKQAAEKNDDLNNNDGNNIEKEKRNRLQELFQKFPRFETVTMDQDIFQTLILLITLELPYFLARVVFTIKYNVSSTTMVFYTTKNVIMIIFLLYRLWVKFKASPSSAVSSLSSTYEDEYNNNRDLMNMKL